MRQSGILMHITSLPGPYGIGVMGKEAYAFVDFLARAGQSVWQILPLTPTGYGNSPYQSLGACAGNPYLIDPDTLAREGLLTQEDLAAFSWGDRQEWVDFGLLYRQRGQLLRRAYGRFLPGREYQAFLKENRDWLPDYTLYLAIKKEQNGASWLQWPEPLRLRKPKALEKARQRLAGEIGFQAFLQYQFDRQWQALRRYAREKGIRIVGDVPIYVPGDCADVWAAPELFQLDENCRPELVAGCPPDAFTADGQLWGNPVYRWKAHKKTGYRWWIRRLERAGALYDAVRLDHFRGFESYWAVPAGDKTARNGKWVPGPGLDFVQAVSKALPKLDFIAEDLGFVTPQVRKLLDRSGYPGMKVLEFAFDSREESDYLPHLYPVHSVCYTGTHDNVTVKQWFDEAAPEDVAYAQAYLGLNHQEGWVWGMIRGAMSSVSQLCIVQMQDYLELGKEGRMNLPGSLSDHNWTWRAAPGFATEELAERIRRMTGLYGRLPKAAP